MTIIALVNNKGGVGKTTSVVHTAYLLAERGLRVLCVDIDTQANLVAHFFPMKTVLAARQQGNTPEIMTRSAHLDILSLSFVEANQSEYATIIRKYAKDYDITLIDCPPSLETRTLAALDAASHVLIPTELERLAIIGLRRLMEELETRSAKILGVFATMTEKTLTPNQAAWLEQLQTMFPHDVLPVRVPTSRIFASAATQITTGFEINGKKQNSALEAYQGITNTILKILGEIK